MPKKNAKIGLVPASHLKIYHSGEGSTSGLKSESQTEISEEKKEKFQKN